MAKKKKEILTELPRVECGRNKGKINHQAMVGMDVEFFYDGQIYTIKILEYIKERNSKFKIKYNNTISIVRCGGLVNQLKIGQIIKGSSNLEFIFNIDEQIKDEYKNIIILERERRIDISGRNVKWYKYRCNNCKTENWIKEEDLLNKKNICYNCTTIWVKYREICEKYSITKEVAIGTTFGSQKEIEVTCPYCGRQKTVKFFYILQYNSIGCSCGTKGHSYPEKFIDEILKQLQIEYKPKYRPIWGKNKEYDFYLQKYNIIIEAHGGQHYNGGFEYLGGKTLKEEQENDKYKEELAVKNGINQYIVIDCRKSEPEWIKNNIMNSKLNELFDLSKIDWLKAHEFAINSNIVKDVCDYWNNKEEWETTTTLAEVFGLSRRTILEYLKKGTKLGWCEYNPQKEKSLVSSRAGKIVGRSGTKRVAMYDLNGNFIMEECSIRELCRRVLKEMDINLNHSEISQVCLGRRKQHKKYVFKYV